MSYARTLTAEKTLARDFLLVIITSFAICLSGKIAIPLWFTPVPIATQNSVILILAALLGARRAFAATLLFLAQGALLGLPVFSNGGAGLHVLIGPTGGYLTGYLIASYVVGYIAERNRSLLNGLLAMSVGNLIIYFCGVSYLTTFLGLSKALMLGVVPFILGDVLKIAAGLSLLKWIGWSK